MPKIFICYRREDSAYPAHQIYGILANHFGPESVVFDVDTIPLGVDFRKHLNEEVSKCDILLAVIGDKWIEMLKQGLDEPNDFVRIEIKAALGREIPVVPVLVGNASVPNEKNLPSEIAGLAYMQGAEVRAGPDLKIHLKRLIDGLENLLPELKPEEKREQKEEKKPKDDVDKTLDKGHLWDKFVKILAEKLSLDSSEIVPEASFVNDLGADELDIIELLMSLEEEFDIYISDEDVPLIQTVKDAFDRVCAY